jgi:hypothetical protein
MLLKELEQQPLDSALKEGLEKISDEVLMAEFEKAIMIIKELINTSTERTSYGN